MRSDETNVSDNDTMIIILVLFKCKMEAYDLLMTEYYENGFKLYHRTILGVAVMD